MKSLARNVNSAIEAQMMGVVTELARGKMFDVEEKLRKDGFMDTDQSSKGDFSDEGWPAIEWSAKVETPEVPGLAELQAQKDKDQKAAADKADKAGDKAGSGAGSGEVSGPLDDFANSTLGGMMQMLGTDLGPAGSDPTAALGDSMMQQYFTMVQQVFKASIRKVTLTINYPVGPAKREFEIVAYFTDDAAMDKIIGFDFAAVQEALGQGGDGGAGGAGGAGGGTGGGKGTMGAIP